MQEHSGRELKTNSNRMEFQAAIEGLRATPVGAQVIVYTDYRVLVSNVSRFSEWESVHWQKKDGRLIPNSDQLIELQRLIQKRSVVFQWVKAHVGNTFNERCDQLCAQSREGL